MSKTVLITGGTGLIGSRLTQLLQQKNYVVKYFSRTPGKVENVEAFGWDVKKMTADPQALNGVDYIVHLAGADVAAKRWTKKRKKEILHSRSRSAALLKDHLSNNSNQVKALISASGTNYYGHDRGDTLLKEESKSGEGFLAQVTRAWEEEANLISGLDIRVAMLRTGIVLSKNGGALPKLARPVRFGIGAPLGSGDQYMSWIHIDDLCNLYIYAIEHENFKGPYNAVAPNPVTNKAFTKVLAKILHRPVFFPAIPPFVLKIIVGEMAEMVLGGLNISSQKIISEGFRFNHPDLEETLKDLLKKN